MKKIFQTLMILFFFLPVSVWGLDLIPGQKGFGTDSRAAYGNGVNPTICIVDTLTNDENSTAYAIADETRNGVPVKTGALGAFLDWNKDNKLIIFEVSGTITVAERWRLDNNYVTIAGQTAPSPGIGLSGCHLNIYGHDILIQHIRLRNDNDGGHSYPVPTARDTLELDRVVDTSPVPWNVVIDHCSMSWGYDEVFSTGTFASNCTVSNCFAYEALAGPSIGKNSKGVMLRGDRIAFIGNLFASNDYRNPRISSTGGLVFKMVIVNNLIYNMKNFNIMDAEPISSTKGKEVSIVGNVIKGGPASTISSAVDYTPAFYSANKLLPAVGSKYFIMNNKSGTNIPATDDPSDWRFVRNATGHSDEELQNRCKVLTPPVWPDGLVAETLSMVETKVLSQAGARPADRGSADTRIASEAASGTMGSIKNCVTFNPSDPYCDDPGEHCGGYPILAENTRNVVSGMVAEGLPPLHSSPHTDAGDGYTNLEKWLHQLAAHVEGGSSSGLLPPARFRTVTQ